MSWLSHVLPEENNLFLYTCLYDRGNNPITGTNNSLVAKIIMQKSSEILHRHFCKIYSGMYIVTVSTDWTTIPQLFLCILTDQKDIWTKWKISGQANSRVTSWMCVNALSSAIRNPEYSAPHWTQTSFIPAAWSLHLSWAQQHSTQLLQGKKLLEN